MASEVLEVNLADLTTEIASVIKGVRTLVNGNAADNAALTTTAKATLVAAINEVNSKLSSAGATINDAAASTTTVYSSTKTVDLINSSRAELKNEILGDASPAYDTLSELMALITSGDATDQTAIQNVVTALGNRVRFDAAQTLTAAQALQARTNIGAASAASVGNTSRDFVAVFRAGLV